MRTLQLHVQEKLVPTTYLFCTLQQFNLCVSYHMEYVPTHLTN